MTHPHEPSMLVAIGSPDSQEGFSTADEMRTTPEAADSFKVRLPILERRIRATIPVSTFRRRGTSATAEVAGERALAAEG